MPQAKATQRRKHKNPVRQKVVRLWGIPRWKLVLAGVLCLGFAAAFWSWRHWAQEETSFQRLAALGKGTLNKVESLPFEGNTHVAQDTSIFYRTDPPVSGSHYPDPTQPGLYESPQLPGNLVHALEHGNIVIYYDRPGPEAMRRLKEWSSHFTNPWAGVVVTPKPGLGRRVILTAWMQRLRLDDFDANAAAAFIDLFQGRGPERPVR